MINSEVKRYERGMQMRVMSLIRIWFALMVCIILCVGFLTLKYSTISKAEKNCSIQTLYTKQSNIPYSNSTNNEKGYKRNAYYESF